MIKKEKNIPVYLRLIGLAKKGFDLLDADRQKEVIRFLELSQSKVGGFTNRAGQPDLYYSLFGVWLALAAGLHTLPEKHKTFFRQHSLKESPVDIFTALLIQHMIKDDFKRPSSLQLLKIALKKGMKTNIPYRLFLLLLLRNAINPQKNFPAITRLVFYFYSAPSGSPCSLLAAMTVLRHEAGLRTEDQKKRLFSFFEGGKGFKAFKEVNEADLLSTAVASFALKTSGADLRMVAPDCIELIGQNYQDGAFTAGNGDNSRDLEYTFYGLLALGCLAG